MPESSTTSPQIEEDGIVGLTPPKRSALLGESRVLIDAMRMLGPLVAAELGCRPERDASLVVVVPGFGADDRSTAPLRRYLHGKGFDVEPWGLGRNLAGTDLAHGLHDLSDRWEFEPRGDYRGEASVPYLCDRLRERVEERHRSTGRSVSLVGWSLGGYIAREVARDLPDIVDRVITLGSPVVGGPKYTAAARFFRNKGMDLDWIEREVARRESRPIRQPITAIYSKSDGIVSWQAAIDRHSERVRHVEIDAAHIGLALNPGVWNQVVAALEEPEL